MNRKTFQDTDRRLRANYHTEARCNYQAELNGGTGLPTYARSLYVAWRGWYGWRVDNLEVRAIGR